MYLTRMRLNPTRRQTRRALASPQVMHAIVLGSIPPGADPEQGRVLWRVDQNSTHEVELYVVSPQRPDLTGAVEQLGWPTGAMWDTAPYRPFLDRLSSGDTWAFRLTANPVRIVAQDGKRGRVVPHRTQEQQRQWLLDNAAKHGFEVQSSAQEEPDVVVRRRGTDSFSRQMEEPSRRDRVQLTRVMYDGRLRITDADRLRHSLTHGIGRGKGYGCGLLTLARRP